MSLYLNSLMVSSLLFMLSVTSAEAVTTAGWGRVNMEGSIIETACAIDTESLDQTIDLSVLPLNQIIRDGGGGPQNFQIRLINCVLGRTDPKLPDWQRFQVTFDGNQDGNGFSIYGSARGIALQIADNQGRIANPGEALPAAEITPGDKRLQYTMRLIGNKQVLRVGDYYSTVRFKLDYY
ncbi:PAP fimbrial minor pilin protein precursor [Serratia quinivorans]|uniref:fimbrial protein n=1 Tax=Serratia quinivorans TaxID=137545 RepID=UPI0021779DB2|nr:fimbrial protein [Serratia quinivorans]CAI1872985.1 PAP fimbrial minor pilin protein precursor [Serratia quinivorans]CAI1901231.1 PAP fimbrial minor pilin protein precursor [Serratia quinivorans]